MLLLQFQSPSQLTLGPSPSFTIEGPCIRQAPDHEIVCRREDDFWHIEDERAAGFHCIGRTVLQFEDRQGRLSPGYGPFLDMRIKGGECVSEEGPFAEFLDMSDQWRHIKSGVRWIIMHLRAYR